MWTKMPPIPKHRLELQAEELIPAQCELRQAKYLNNLVEQDHRFIKRLTKPGLGFFAFETAWRTDAADMR
jgi:IS6 family transposase